jgi:type 1 glutamine amidotransferase
MTLLGHGLAALLLQHVASGAAPGELPRVLFLTHSAGFVHGVVARPDADTLATAEEHFLRLCEGRFDARCTQDCAELSADRLAGLDAIVFMTTGELPIPDADRAAFVSWLRAGGAFVGIHCATDTLYEYPPYVDLIGGTFDGHPWHQEVGVRVEVPGHPATAHLGAGFRISDEIYQFRNFRRFPNRVLLSLEPGTFDASKGKRADGDYPVAWTRDYGDGRVFYLSLGHEPAVWADERFGAVLMGGLAWTLDGGDEVVAPPPGAQVLIGSDAGALGQAWTHRDGQPFAWRALKDLAHGGVEVIASTGDIVSTGSFGDALVHVEFRIPAMPGAQGQGRGNSGVYVQGRYEVQVLDSLGLEPGLGDCGALYGQKVPDTNACRAPERWQTYDIEFRAPRLDSAGGVTEPARMSVWQNGIRIHDEVELKGPTAAGMEGEVARGPLLLQDHGNPVRYRNVWVLPR